MRSLTFLCLLLASALLPGRACAAAPVRQTVQLEIVRTSSEISGALLPRYGTLYIEVAYSSAQPVRLQARAYAGGRSLDQGQAMNASVLHPAGSGSALVWVSYGEPAVIDEIRITAYDDRWQPMAELPVVTRTQWLAKPADRRADPPQWVSALIVSEKRIAAETPPSAGGAAAGIVTAFVGMFIFAAVPGYFVIQAVALVVLRGRWRMAASAPLAVMVPATLHAFWALAAGSNLWPILVIFAAPLGFIYLSGLFGLRLLRQPAHSG